MRLLILSLLLPGSWAESASTCEPNDASSAECEAHDSSSPSSEQQIEQICGLWLAKSTATDNSLGLFAGVDIASGEAVLKNGGEPHIPVYDTNRNEWSRIHDAVWNRGIARDTMLQVDYQSHSFLPGVGLTATCQHSLANIHLHPTEDVDSLGVHRHSDPIAGSFTYRHHSEFVASKPLPAGQELLVNCQRANPHSSTSSSQKQMKNTELHQSVLSELQQTGLCLDNLVIQPSTIPKAGRGAFVKRHVKKGETIAVSPVIAFDRSQTYVVEQEMDYDDEMAYGEELEGDQLFLNYCYDHPDSNVLLLPTGPGVNYINHHSKSNAAMRWSESPLNGQRTFLNISDTELMDEDNITMILEFVALRDIQAGEEIFLHYGEEWVEALKEFEEEGWEVPPFSSKYASAAEYQRQHPDKPIQTMAEQRQKKYPRNIATTCLFRETVKSFPQETVTWTSANEDCLRPCRILDRTINDKDGASYYTAEVLPILNEVGDQNCQLAKTHKIVNQIPAKAVLLTDRPYTTDEHIPGTFRHSIRVSSGLYPDPWLKDDPGDMGAFLQPELKSGQIEPICWKSNGEPIADNAYLLGLSPKVRESLLHYCDEIGISEYFRDLTYRGNGLDFHDDEEKTFGGLKWHVQRPPMHWNSNMHWISPYNAETNLDFLQELGMAGFDEVLEQIGEHLDMDGLAVYHLSFIAVSHCSEGFIHKDISGTGGKVFNVIIPLILAKDTGPEFDVAENDMNGLVGRLRYQYDVATMMGDNAFHATSAADYRTSREMRMAATIYIADINEENIDSIMDHHTQHYPPSDQPLVLLDMAGTHWKADDPSIRLPEYAPNPDAQEVEEEDESDDEYWEDDDWED
jgi:hypothetical protein